MSRFLNDKEIEAPYLTICEDETIINVLIADNKDSGWIEIQLPQNEKRNIEISNKDDYEDDDLLDEEKNDNFTIYDSGKIAFDSWYPEKVYLHIVSKIIEEIKKTRIVKQEKTQSKCILNSKNQKKLTITIYLIGE